MAKLKDSIVLRKHQSEAVDACFKRIREDKSCVPVLEIPPGGGKSLIAAIIAIKAITTKCRAIICTNNSILVGQNYQEFNESVDKIQDAGILSAEHGEYSTENQVLFAGIQTLVNYAEYVGKINVFVIDECHCLNAESMCQYKIVIDALYEVNPKMRVIGLTASPYRQGQGMITWPFKDRETGKIFPSFFTEISYKADINDLIAAGYLCPIKSIDSSLSIEDKEGEKSEIEEKGTVKSHSKAAAPSQFGMFSDPFEPILESAVREFTASVKELGLKKVIIFANNTNNCVKIKSMIQNSYVMSTVYKDTLTKKEMLSWFAADRNSFDEPRYLINIDMLSTGYNQKDLDAVVALYSTVSVSKYVQTVGRLLRVFPGKKYGYFFDYGTNIKRLGSIDNLTVKSRGDGKAKIKICEDNKFGTGCGENNFSSAKKCWSCEKEFDTKKSLATFSHFASGMPVLAGGAVSESEESIRKCTDYYWDYHSKAGSRDSLTITVYDGDSVVKMAWFVIASHNVGFSAQMINKLSVFFKNYDDFSFLKEKGLFEHNARDVAHFLNKNKETLLKTLNAVKLLKEGKFFKIIDYDLD